MTPENVEDLSAAIDALNELSNEVQAASMLDCQAKVVHDAAELSRRVESADRIADARCPSINDPDKTSEFVHEVRDLIDFADHRGGMTWNEADVRFAGRQFNLEIYGKGGSDRLPLLELLQAYSRRRPRKV